jgi:hypothetical protein
MRIRKIAAVVAAALASTVMLAAPASAGVGESVYCSDGGWTDVPILTTPITLGIEANVNLAGDSWVALCYATSPVGFGGAQVTGGLLKVGVRADGTGYYQCRPDGNAYVLLVGCNGTYDLNPLPPNTPISVYLNTLTVDTSVTAPVTLGKTGIEIDLGILSGAPVDPAYPCIWINGLQLVPGCGTQIV